MPSPEPYLQRCLELALLGAGKVAPNPLVGCVIVHEDKIIGEGWHRTFGGPHAEVNAIGSVQNCELLSSSVLYVNLEPCAHHGKTPPCADLILQCGIPKVVIGGMDPNPLVAGKGIQRLRDGGVEVTAGVMEDECRFLNRRFYTWIGEQRPHVILKWAQTVNGYLAPDATRMSPEQFEEERHITGFTVQKLVHRWRTEEDVIMVGTNTALWDNPALNARAWDGRAPARAAIDRNLRLPQRLKLFDQSQRTLLFNGSKNLIEGNTEWIALDFDLDWYSQLLSNLYERNLQSLVIEGGNRLLRHVIDSALWDEALIFTSNKVIREGVPAPDIAGILRSTDEIDGVRLHHYLRT